MGIIVSQVCAGRCTRLHTTNSCVARRGGEEANENRRSELNSPSRAPRASLSPQRINADRKEAQWCQLAARSDDSSRRVR
jgi:hypothetical protein